VLHACPRDMIADSGEALPNQPTKPYTNRAHRAQKGSKRSEFACYDSFIAFRIAASKAEIRHAGTDQPLSPCP
jgi:hypothetical protein